LAQAGVLKGQVVTSYWRSIKELTESFEVQIVEQRVVKSGKIWTAGGVTSGIDLALELINEVAGKDSMDKVRLLLEYFPTSAHNCQLDLANDLPNYGSNQISRTDLPKYITDSIGVSS
jgi:transcriptional regulator GlxA family with amidase domain